MAIFENLAVPRVTENNFTLSDKIMLTVCVVYTITKLQKTSRSRGRYKLQILKKLIFALKDLKNVEMKRC